MVEATPGFEVWLVRHGETEWARQGRHTGRTDVPLTDLGRAQARALADRLRGRAFGIVLASPRVRALDTARLAGFSDVVEVDPDLAEWDYGADEGRTTLDIQRERPGWSIWDAGPRDGESIDAVARRADRVLSRVRTVPGDALLFGHGHLLRILAARWLGLTPRHGALFALSTASISVLGWERDRPVLLHWNEPADGS
ncbi:MAG: phosphoglycerate mutase [Chloroflexota bacterium]|nr:MAG: phosphoglycerate mutase [Chloroflexota bacterium]